MQMVINTTKHTDGYQHHARREVIIITMQSSKVVIKTMYLRMWLSTWRNLLPPSEGLIYRFPVFSTHCSSTLAAGFSKPQVSM
jgi:hypothetical protein